MATYIDLSTLRFRAHEQGGLEHKHPFFNFAEDIEIAQPITWSPKIRMIALNEETDTAQAIRGIRVYSVGQNSETDVVHSLTHVKAKTIGQTTETETTQTINRVKTITLGQATENDTVQAITVQTGDFIAVAQVTETDTSQTISWNPKNRLVNIVTETDAAQSITVSTSGGQSVFTELDNPLWAGNLDGQEFDDTMPV